MEQKLEALREAIVSANGTKVNELLVGINSDMEYENVLSHSIKPALDTLCASIKNRQGAVPELLMGLKQVGRISTALERINDVNSMPDILIGVVEGDIHDMGKNIVRDVCRGYGYNVIDLGTNVPAASFAETAQQTQPAVACLSTMMSTTVDAMATTITELKASRPEIRIVIGGAFMDREIAKKLSADGYAEDASTVMDEIERVLQ